MKKQIPNLITLLNLLSGCIALVFAVKGHLETATIFVFAGIVFDFFDGLVARALHVQSALGVQLDSLADMVTCGVVPGVFLFQLINMSYTGDWGNWEALQETTGITSWAVIKIVWLPLIGFIFTLAAAFRLANFNLDEDQASSFTGLPVPASTLFVISLPLILFYHNNEMLNNLILNKWFLILVTLVLSVLMNSRIKLFALKFKDLSFKNNALRYTFLLMSIVLLVTMKFMAVPFIVILYIVLSLIGGKVFKSAEV